MDIDNDPSGLIDSEASRFDTGIDQTPLSGPVVAHGAGAVDVPAFHPVRPVHLGMHCRQRPVDVARIEGVVRVREKVAVHRPHTHDTGIIVARRTGPQRVAGPIHATIEFRSVGNPARAVWSNLMEGRTSDDSHLVDRLRRGDARAFDELERSGLEATLHRASAELPEERRIVVVLRDLEGLSYEEIAAALDLELGTVRSRLPRARMDLKEKLERFLP